MSRVLFTVSSIKLKRNKFNNVVVRKLQSRFFHLELCTASDIAIENVLIYFNTITDLPCGQSIIRNAQTVKRYRLRMVCEGPKSTTMRVKCLHIMFADPLWSYLFYVHSYLGECARRTVEKIKAKAFVYITIATRIKSA
jgi:hypothetical protein